MNQRKYDKLYKDSFDKLTNEYNKAKQKYIKELNEKFLNFIDSIFKLHTDIESIDMEFNVESDDEGGGYTTLHFNINSDKNNHRDFRNMLNDSFYELAEDLDEHILNNPYYKSKEENE